MYIKELGYLYYIFRYILCAIATLCDYFSIKTMYIICIVTLYWHFILNTLFSTLVKYMLTDKSKYFYVVLSL